MGKSGVRHMGEMGAVNELSTPGSGLPPSLTIASSVSSAMQLEAKTHACGDGELRAVTGVRDASL